VAEDYIEVERTAERVNENETLPANI